MSPIQEVRVSLEKGRDDALISLRRSYPRTRSCRLKMSSMKSGEAHPLGKRFTFLSERRRATPTGEIPRQSSFSLSGAALSLSLAKNAPSHRFLALVLTALLAMLPPVRSMVSRILGVNTPWKSSVAVILLWSGNRNFRLPPQVQCSRLANHLQPRVPSRRHP